MSRITIEEGETYTVDKGDVEHYSSAEVSGTLELAGTVMLDDEHSPSVADGPRTDTIVEMLINRLAELIVSEVIETIYELSFGVVVSVASRRSIKHCSLLSER